MARCHFLDLCQELRDIIYEYTLSDDDREIPGTDIPTDTVRTKALAIEDGDQAACWQYRTTSLTTRSPTWLSLMKCNRQLRHEVSNYLERISLRQCADSAAITAKGHIDLRYPDCTATVQPPSLPPQHLRTLDLTVSLTNLYHPTTLPPSKTIATAVWNMVKRYRAHGPILGRQNQLSPPLKIERVRITLLEPREEDLVFVHANPWMQMQSHYSCLKWGLGVLARGAMEVNDGLDVRVIETKFGRKGWERVFLAKPKEDVS